MDDTRRRRVLAVLGPGRASEAVESVAARVGAAAAGAGWVVLTGGGPGAMAAASRGAAEAGGLAVGVLPGDGVEPGYPNPWVEVAIVTGLGTARNAVNVLSADLCVAVGGGPGTLSEIGLALKSGREVWCWGGWTVTPGPGADTPLPRVFDTPEALLEALRERLVG